LRIPSGREDLAARTADYPGYHTVTVTLVHAVGPRYAVMQSNGYL